MGRSGQPYLRKNRFCLTLMNVLSNVMLIHFVTNDALALFLIGQSIITVVGASDVGSFLRCSQRSHSP